MNDELVKTLRATTIAIVVISVVIGGMILSIKGCNNHARFKAKAKAIEQSLAEAQQKQQEENKLLIAQTAQKNSESEDRRNAEEAKSFIQNFDIDWDEVRGITFIKPKFASEEKTGCYLYISDKADGNPALLFRCIYIGNNLDHFDRVMFRAGNKTHIIENEKFALIHHGRNDDREKWMYYDFIVSQGDNQQSLQSLLSVQSKITFRFYSSVYSTSDDIILSPENLEGLRQTYGIWEKLKRKRNEQFEDK